MTMKEPVQKINVLSNIQAEGNFSAKQTAEFTDVTITWNKRIYTAN